MIITIHLGACTEDAVEPSAEETPATRTAVDIAPSETIPVEEALENLQKFLSSSTRERIGSASFPAQPLPCVVQVVRNPTVLIEKDEDGKESKIAYDSLFYVANYSNGGAAILSADRRIGTEVLAVLDKGSLDVPANYVPFSTTRPIYKDYPTTGPGFYKLPEYGNELFMNPNTAVLANVAKRDTIVGNFEAELVSKESPEDLLLLDLCAVYSRNRIRLADMEMHRIDFGYDNGEVIGPDIMWENVEKSDWTIVKQRQPLLSRFLFWHQQSPFNDYFPWVRNFWGKGQRAYAGCFPLAVAKVLAYHKGPRPISYRGYTVDWDALRMDMSSEAFRKSAATLLYSVAKGCNSYYFYEGTFTFPNDVWSFMGQMGYPEARKRHYDFSYVEEWVDNSKPLIIYAVHHANWTKSHAWNLDGYKKQKRTVTTTKRTGSGTIISKETKIEEVNYVHMDMGWAGNRNGYYVSDLFKTGEESIPYDNPNQGDRGKFNYTGYVRIIKY